MASELVAWKEAGRITDSAMAVSQLVRKQGSHSGGVTLDTLDTLEQRPL